MNLKQNNKGYIHYNAFICHETTTGHNFALNLKRSLEKIGMKAFVAPEDIKLGNSEKDVRYSVLRRCQDVIVIITGVALTSGEVSDEIKKALEWKKNIIPCLEARVDLENFKQSFPSLYEKQWLKFKDEYDLANQVTSLYMDQKPKPVKETTKVLEKVFKSVLEYKGVVDFSKAKITILTARETKAGRLDISDTKIDTIKASNASIGRMDASNSEISELDATGATMNLLDISWSKIEKLNICRAMINVLEGSEAKIGILDIRGAIILDLDMCNATVDEIIGFEDATFVLPPDLSGATVKKYVTIR